MPVPIVRKIYNQDLVELMDSDLESEDRLELEDDDSYLNYENVEMDKEFNNVNDL